MDGTHDFIPSRVAGQQFFLSFLPRDQLLVSIPNPEYKLFLIKDLTCCSIPKYGQNCSQNVPKKRQASVTYTNRYPEACPYQQLEGVANKNRGNPQMDQYLSVGSQVGEMNPEKSMESVD
jgi:hypothetical protein